jgi:hypothetical protein
LSDFLFQLSCRTVATSLQIIVFVLVVRKKVMLARVCTAHTS